MVVNRSSAISPYLPPRVSNPFDRRSITSDDLSRVLTPQVGATPIDSFRACQFVRGSFQLYPPSKFAAHFSRQRVSGRTIPLSLLISFFPCDRTIPPRYRYRRPAFPFNCEPAANSFPLPNSSFFMRSPAADPHRNSRRPQKVVETLRDGSSPQYRRQMPALSRVSYAPSRLSPFFLLCRSPTMHPTPVFVLLLPINSFESFPRAIICPRLHSIKKSVHILPPPLDLFAFRRDGSAQYSESCTPPYPPLFLAFVGFAVLRHA